MAKLSAGQVDSALKGLDGWTRKGKFITKTFEFDAFMDGIKFVDDIAAIAEELQHHPDIHIRWTTIRLEIQTHDQGGITKLDLELAKTIEDRLEPSSTTKVGPAKPKKRKK